MSEHRPVGHMEHMLEVGSAVARDFEADKQGTLKHLLRAAVLLDEIKKDFYFTGAAMWALMAVFVALAPVGRLLGYGTGYQEDDDQVAAAGSDGKRVLPATAVVGSVTVTSLGRGETPSPGPLQV